MEEKEILAPCTGYDLSDVKSPVDYVRVASVPEALEKIEECMRTWIKHIEHVRSGFMCVLGGRDGGGGHSSLSPLLCVKLQVFVVFVVVSFGGEGHFSK